MDAANILKPALARGLLHCIGATTFSEYDEYLAKDGAMARRLQPIVVDEPSAQDTFRILRGIQGRYEAFHGVRYGDAALQAAITLAVQYSSDRKLPDSAIDLMDEAAALRQMLLEEEGQAAAQSEAGIGLRRGQRQGDEQLGGKGNAHTNKGQEVVLSKAGCNSQPEHGNAAANGGTKGSSEKSWERVRVTSLAEVAQIGSGSCLQRTAGYLSGEARLDGTAAEKLAGGLRTEAAPIEREPEDLAASRDVHVDLPRSYSGRSLTEHQERSRIPSDRPFTAGTCGGGTSSAIPGRAATYFPNPC
jgi:hypothetical protein